MSGPSLPAVQRLPPELVQPIVVHVLRDQVESLARRPSSSAPLNVVYASLALLHLCSVFRRCTVEILAYMWGGDDTNTTIYNHITLLNMADVYLAICWNHESPNPDFVGALAPVKACNKRFPPRVSPVYSLLLVLGFVRLHRNAMNYMAKIPLRHHGQLEALKSETLDRCITMAGDLHTQVSACHERIPTWQVHGILDNLLSDCLSMAVYLIKLDCLGQASRIMNETLEGLPSISVQLVPEEAEQFADMVEQLAEDYWSDAAQLPLEEVKSLAQACDVEIHLHDWSINDARASGVTSIIREIKKRTQCGQLSSVAGRRIQRCLRVFGGLTDVEAELSGLPYSPSKSIRSKGCEARTTTSTSAIPAE
ncbi:hypothetical protein PENSPDRAFT_752291 [Peniophora sp. CONT]|nr:hypothetical protein PENSPDRAFT_752291 [Peniophora sp. CONT]